MSGSGGPTLDDLEVEAEAAGMDFFEFVEQWANARPRAA
jgi:hypothetical protein